MTVQTLIEKLNRFDPTTPVAMGVNVRMLDEEVQVEIEDIGLNPIKGAIELVGTLVEDEDYE